MTGGAFVIWASTGNATFDSSTSASTTVTLTGSSTVTANFLAPTQTVTTNADSGAGSLRQAIDNLAPDGTITFNLPTGSNKITLGSEIAITKPVTINGANTGGSGTPVTIQVTEPGVSAWRALNLDPGAQQHGQSQQPDHQGRRHLRLEQQRRWRLSLLRNPQSDQRHRLRIEGEKRRRRLFKRHHAVHRQLHH